MFITNRLENLAMYAGIGTFILAVISLFWNRSNSNKIKELSISVNSGNKTIRQEVDGDGNLTSGGDINL